MHSLADLLDRYAIAIAEDMRRPIVAREGTASPSSPEALPEMSSQSNLGNEVKHSTISLHTETSV